MVLKYFPYATVQFIEFVLWEKTGFPAFYDGDPADVLERQISRYKKAIDQGKDICFICVKIKKLVTDQCKKCHKIYMKKGFEGFVKK